MNIQTESTEDKIISATFRLIRKDGIDKVTTKKIAAEAGVNEVTIFRKFNNSFKDRFYRFKTFWFTCFPVCSASFGNDDLYLDLCFYQIPLGFCSWCNHCAYS